MKKQFWILCMLYAIPCFTYGQIFDYNGYQIDITNVINYDQRIQSIANQSASGIDIYYLIKRRDNTDLKIDSSQVYYTDILEPDVASEGYIRFVDSQTQLVGLLNSYGDIAIPAMYIAMTNVQNGLVVALLDGTRENIGVMGDSHWVMVGGETLLLNTQNEILVRDFSEPNMELDYYSLQILDKPIEALTYTSYLGVNGKYYNFLNLEKDFKSSIIEEFLPSTTTNNWITYLSDRVEINIELECLGDYDKVDKATLLSDYKEKIDKVFRLARSSASTQNSTNLVFEVDNWSGFVNVEQIEPNELSLYFNLNNKWRMELFPLFELTIKEVVSGKARNNHFEFYRDVDGSLVLYRITLRSTFYSI